MKKKGFTLIELLAVIVILAIIALIATPALLNIIENSRRSSVEDSTRNILNAGKTFCIKETTLNKKELKEINLLDANFYKGEKPDKGIISFDKSCNPTLNMYMNGYCVTTDSSGELNVIKSNSSDCGIGIVVVTFNNEGHITTKEYESGSEYGELPTLTKEGYVFDGWYTEEIEGKKVLSTDKVTNNITLYARWELKQHRVTLFAQRGSFITSDDWDIDTYNNTATKYVNHGEEIGELPEIECSDCVVLGWASINGYSITSGTIVTNMIDAHLQTMDKEINIGLSTDGGYVEPSTITVIYGESYGILPEPTKEGYTFQGWYNSEMLIESNTIVNEETVPYNYMLEAKWEPNMYTVTFVFNDGVTPDQTYSVCYGCEFKSLFPIVTNTATKEFLGWNYKGQIVYSDEFYYDSYYDEIIYAEWRDFECYEGINYCANYDECTLNYSYEACNEKFPGEAEMYCSYNAGACLNYSMCIGHWDHSNCCLYFSEDENCIDPN